MAYKRRDGIYHVYHLWDETDKMNYGGSHTSYKGIDPKNDTYMGSSTKVDAAIAKGNVFIKTIISTHDTKEEMIEAEQKYLKENDAVNSSDWYNQVIAFPDFDGYWYYNPETKEEIYVVEGTQPDNYVTGRPSMREHARQLGHLSKGKVQSKEHRQKNKKYQNNRTEEHKKNLAKANRERQEGKTWEEIHGEEKAKELKEKKSAWANRSYEERFGEEKAKQVKAKLSKYTSSRVWYYNPETMKQIYVVEGTQPDNYVTGRPSISRLRWYYNSETMKQIYVVKGTQPDNYVAGRLTYKRMVKGDK